MSIKAPFVYFGGKSKCSDLVFSLFPEDIKNYIEPFAGSLGVLLGQDYTQKRVETINDIDGYITNFWRAVVANPIAVAVSADNPVNELDLHARHYKLVIERDDLTNKLLIDPLYYDAQLAGWWAWGVNAWIGSGWCSGQGPWAIVDGLFGKQKGTGVNKQLPHLGGKGKGVNKQLPHLGDKGTGVNKQLTYIIESPRDSRHQFILDWCLQLAERLRHVRVTCGDWKRVVKPSVTTASFGSTGVFLDPPYHSADCTYGTLTTMDTSINDEVLAYCLDAIHNPDLHVVLAGLQGDYPELLTAGYKTIGWKAGKGYARKEASKNARKQEVLYYYPKKT